MSMNGFFKRRITKSHSCLLENGLKDRKLRLGWKKVAEEDRRGGMLNNGGSATLVGDTFYCVNPLSQVSVFSCQAWQWTYFGEFWVPTGSWHEAELVDDKIYIFCTELGMYRDTTSRYTLLEYDVVLIRDRSIVTVKEGACGQQCMTLVVAYSGKDIITFGGLDPRTQRYSNEVHAFNVERKAWKMLRLRGRQPEPRIAHAAGICGRSIYIYGGYSQRGIPLHDLWIAHFGMNGAPIGLCYNQRTKFHPHVAILHLITVFQWGVDLDEFLKVYYCDSNTWDDQKCSHVILRNRYTIDSDYYFGVTTFDGVVYFAETGVYLLSEE